MQSHQIPYLPAEEYKHMTLFSPERYKLPTDLHPLILSITEFGSGVKHKIFTFPQAMPAAMAEAVDEEVSKVNATYRSVRRVGGLSVHLAVTIIGGIMEEIRRIEEEVDGRIIAWDKRERRGDGEVEDGVVGMAGGEEESKGLDKRVMKNLKELGERENKRERIKEIWGKIRGMRQREKDGDTKAGNRDGEKGNGKAEDSAEPEDKVEVEVDTTPRDDDGDLPPGFQPIMEREWKIFQDDNTHV